MSVLAAPVSISLAYQNWRRFSRNPTATIGAATNDRFIFAIRLICRPAAGQRWLAPHLRGT